MVYSEKNERYGDNAEYRSHRDDDDDVTGVTTVATFKASNVRRAKMAHAEPQSMKYVLATYNHLSDDGAYAALSSCYHQFRRLLHYIRPASIEDDATRLLDVCNEELSVQKRRSIVAHLFSDYQQKAALPQDSYPVAFEDLDNSWKTAICRKPPTEEVRLRKMVKQFRKSLVKAIGKDPRIANVLMGYLLLSQLDWTVPPDIATSTLPSGGDDSSGGASDELREYVRRRVSELGLPIGCGAYVEQFHLGWGGSLRPESVREVHVGTASLTTFCQPKSVSSTTS